MTGGKALRHLTEWGKDVLLKRAGRNRKKRCAPGDSFPGAWFYLVLLLTAVSTAQSAPPEGDRIPLTVRDAVGVSTTLILGTDSLATEEYDIALGELPVPPVPSEEIFDARFVSLPGRPRTPDTGSYTDLRRLRSPAQVDSFGIVLRTASDAYPITVSVDSAAAGRCDSLCLLLPRNGHYTRELLKEGRTLTIGESTTHEVILVRYGIRTPRASGGE